MRRIILLFTVAAMMAVMLMSMSAGPASALVIGGDNDHNNSFFFDRDHRDFDRDHGDDFFNNFDRDGLVSVDVGDVENESGDVALENTFSIEGNNNNACLGQQQFGQTGNFTNQQGDLQYVSPLDDLEFAGGELEFAPENETACEQKVQQAAAASSVS